MTANLAAATDAVKKALEAAHQQLLEKLNEPEPVSTDDTMSVAEHAEKLRVALKAQKAELKKKHAQATSDTLVKAHAKHAAATAVLAQHTTQSYDSLVDILSSLTDAGMKRVTCEVDLQKALIENQSAAAVRSANNNAQEAHKEHMAALKVAHARLSDEMQAREDKERRVGLEEGMGGICIPN